ncbi:3-beta-hydroxysteroid-Delta(8),Delta(7)-isomerase-like [Indicator indicator]|uniref:3-beta-hydroxysteroid-Delta(8), Delta(7)-isomerase-like n=1 Tax=Indicator indicator TaxID=1002788 RepID=UPI0023E04949|nr:3-beta-hydroxysteroid-Delta(8),Delta(7)-isomerase-like [Indicator indicator]
MATQPHPYWPRSLVLPGYVPPSLPGWQCAGAVAAAAAALLAAGWALGGGGSSGGACGRGLAHRLALCWFLLCAGIHGVLEGWFSLRHRSLPAATGLLADVWKEYAKADSRYLTSDPFTVAMESVTAWGWGPLSFLTFLCLRRGHPARHVLQLLVSLGQLYGDILYYATEGLGGWSHSDPHPFYFWGYFVGLNGVWVLVPSILLVDACCKLVRAQQALDRPKHKGQDRIGPDVVLRRHLAAEGGEAASEHRRNKLPQAAAAQEGLMVQGFADGNVAIQGKLLRYAGCSLLVCPGLVPSGQ